MRLRSILFPEGGRARNFLRKYNRKIKVMIHGKVPEVSKNENYRRIMERLEPRAKELKRQRDTKFEIQPKISIIVVLKNMSVENLSKLLKSVKKQTYSNWELCVINRSKLGDDKIRNICTKDKKIKYKFIEENEQLNSIDEAIKIATGDYVAILKQEDLLPVFCLYEFVKCINEEPDVEFIYSDEDKFVDNLSNRCEPFFKPDFAIDTLRGSNYIGNFAMYKKELIDTIEGEKESYDLALKMSEKTNKIKHIQKVLYHDAFGDGGENHHSDSAAAEKASIESHLKRVGLKADVKTTEVTGVYEVQYDVIGNPKVSILIPNKDEKDTLKVCVESILSKTTYNNYEIVVIENNSSSQEIQDYYKEIEAKENVRVLYFPEKEFNYSKLINFGVRNTDGAYIIQLNNDTELITENWLEKMLGFCQREDVGAIGVRLYYPDMSLQHGGVVLGLGGVAGHRFLYLPKNEHAHGAEEMKIANVTAVTAACIMAKRKTYEEVNYMNEDLAVAFNDVDFCLKIREKGLLIVYNPFVELLHYESKSRGKEDSPEKQQRFSDEIDIFMSKWKSEVEKGDPYYNNNMLIPEIQKNSIQSTI